MGVLSGSVVGGGGASSLVSGWKMRRHALAGFSYWRFGDDGEFYLIGVGVYYEMLLWLSYHSCGLVGFLRPYDLYQWPLCSKFL
jgi:hypothetical protein